MRIVAEAKRLIQVGQKIHDLTCIGPAFIAGRRQYAVFQCQCGTITASSINNVLRGEVRACGCRHKLGAPKHGMSRTRLFRIWADMRKRCRDPKTDHYHRYGGRGIKVCDEWQTFEPFRDWALANGYSEELTIDRTDNDGNYEAANCRWIPRNEQQDNTSRSVYFSAFGETKTLKKWSEDERCSVPVSVLNQRIRSLGWSVERAVCTPLLRRPAWPRTPLPPVREIGSTSQETLIGAANIIGPPIMFPAVAGNINDCRR